MKKKHLFWILWILIAFSSVSQTCIPSETLRPIVAHRREFLLAKANVTDPVIVDPNALQILQGKSETNRSFRANDVTEKESDEDSVTEAPVTTTTSTFKPDTIDDP